MTSVRGVTSDDWREWRLLRRQALADSADAVGSTLAEWSGDGDTELRWRERLSQVPVNLIADDKGEPAGMLSLTAVVDDEAEIISMWVAPRARGRGAGDALLRAVLDHAGAAGAKRVALNVRVDNERALRLDRRAGFVEVGWAMAPDATQAERRMELDLPPERHG